MALLHSQTQRHMISVWAAHNLFEWKRYANIHQFYYLNGVGIPVYRRPYFT